MLRLTISAIAACALLAAPGIAAAQTVDEIVARHIAARGSRDKLAAIETIKLTRTVGNGIGTPLKVVIYKKRPNLFRLEQALAQPGATMTPRGINGEAVWDFVQGKPVTRETQLAAEARDLEGDFDGWLVDWKEKGYTVAFAGREASPAGELLKLAVTLKSGLARTVYLDARTYLDRRHTGVLHLPNGRTFDVTIDYDNWREIEGVKFPFDITEERTGKEPVVTLVTYTEKIEVNVAMDVTLFAAPVK